MIDSQAILQISDFEANLIEGELTAILGITGSIAALLYRHAVLLGKIKGYLENKFGAKLG